MGREIKFRAWHSGTKEMMSWGKIKYEGESYDCSVFASVFLDADYLLLQFTGLKDENGVEIYEGDIVRIAGTGNVEVKFPFFELYEEVYSGHADIESIVGNIYQNPELLEKANG